MFRGLNRINPENQKFIHYKYELNTGFVNGEIVLIQGSLRTGTVSKIFEDKSGDIWIANRGLAKFNREKKIFIIYNDKIGNIYSMYEDKSGIIWIGTDGGLYKFNRNKNTFFCYKNDPNNPLSISSNRIGAICEHKSGVLWIGTSHGLDKFDQKREQFIHYKHDPEDYTSLSDDHIISLYKDKDKNLWIGTFNGGLNKLIYNEDAENSLPFIKYLNNHKNPGSISNNKIFSIYEDKSGIMWVGTYGGLNKFDRENNSFKHFRVKDGLISDIIFGVLEDDYGNIWLGTSKGISKFDLKQISLETIIRKTDFSTPHSLNGVFLK